MIEIVIEVGVMVAATTMVAAGTMVVTPVAAVTMVVTTVAAVTMVIGAVLGAGVRAPLLDTHIKVLLLSNKDFSK